MSDYENANHRRDARLRKRVLQLLHAARVRPESGWCSGTFLYDVLDESLAPAQKMEGDEHLLGLLRDLVAAAYAEERDDRTRRGQRAGLDSFSYRVTARGTALVTEAIDPDPLVDDPRLVRPARG